MAAHCPDLTYLNLCECVNVTDASVVSIARGCPSLMQLVLSRTRVQDDGVSALAAHCPSLHTLDLFNCNVSDASLFAVLEGCKDIQVCNVDIYMRCAWGVCVVCVGRGYKQRTRFPYTWFLSFPLPPPPLPPPVPSRSLMYRGATW